jgi:hypothetical protein
VIKNKESIVLSLYVIPSYSTLGLGVLRGVGSSLRRRSGERLGAVDLTQSLLYKALVFSIFIDTLPFQFSFYEKNEKNCA